MSTSPNAGFHTFTLYNVTFHSMFFYINNQPTLSTLPDPHLTLYSCPKPPAESRCESDGGLHRKRSVAAVCRSSDFKRYNDLSIFPKPQDELLLHGSMCLDPDGATLEPFTPRVFGRRASFAPYPL